MFPRYTWSSDDSGIRDLDLQQVIFSANAYTGDRISVALQHDTSKAYLSATLMHDTGDGRILQPLTQNPKIPKIPIAVSEE